MFVGVHFVLFSCDTFEIVCLVFLGFFFLNVTYFRSHDVICFL